MLRLARRTAPLIAFGLLAIAVWSWWPAAWPQATRWLAPMLLLGAVVLLRRIAWEPSASRARGGRPLTLDESVRRAAATWDARHGAPEDAEAEPDDEPWRASLGASWEETSGAEDEDGEADDGDGWRSATR